MDDRRFDLLTKSLSTGLSRRRLLQGIIGAIGSSIAVSSSTKADPGKGQGSKKCYGAGSQCTNAKQCCSAICTNRQCEPEVPPDPCAGVNCDDGNPCTTDSCSLGACSNTALPVGTPCPDGFCNSSATCVAGVCAPGTTRSCYSGPAGTEGIGECQAGTETCDDTAQWGACVGEITPVAEVCGDGLDNDCSGTVDDDCEPTCEPNFVYDPDFGDCVRDQTTCPANLTPSGDLRDCALNGFNLSGINLSGADLSGAGLASTNLSGAILTNANLTGVYAPANFIGANLIGANMSGGSFVQAAFTGANLFGANLSDAEVIIADLTGANLSVANLTGTLLSGANLHDAELLGAIWGNTTCPDDTISDNVGGTCCNNLLGAVASSC